MWLSAASVNCHTHRRSQPRTARSITYRLQALLPKVSMLRQGLQLLRGARNPTARDPCPAAKERTRDPTPYARDNAQDEEARNRARYTKEGGLRWGKSSPRRSKDARGRYKGRRRRARRRSCKRGKGVTNEGIECRGFATASERARGELRYLSSTYKRNSDRNGKHRLSLSRPHNFSCKSGPSKNDGKTLIFLPRLPIRGQQPPRPREGGQR